MVGAAALALTLAAGAIPPLVDAVKSGDVTTARALVAKGADVNAPEPDGTTALHWAVQRNDVDLVSRLLRAGAKVNVKNSFGVSPMSEAALTANPALLDRLLAAGADQDATPERTRQAVLVQRTGQLMYEALMRFPVISGLQPEFGWDAGFGETADGLMYVGAHRNFPHHLFALGGSAISVTGAFVAARMLLRAVTGEAQREDEVLGWTR